MRRFFCSYFNWSGDIQLNAMFCRYFLRTRLYSWCTLLLGASLTLGQEFMVRKFSPKKKRQRKNCLNKVATRSIDKKQLESGIFLPLRMGGMSMQIKSAKFPSSFFARRPLGARTTTRRRRWRRRPSCRRRRLRWRTTQKLQVQKEKANRG